MSIKSSDSDDSDIEEYHSSNNRLESINNDKEKKISKSENKSNKILNKKRKRKSKESPVNIEINENQKQNNIKDVELKEEPKPNNSFFNEDKIIFKYESGNTRIDSVFVYNNGDIFIFKEEETILYEGKTFNKLLEVNFIGSVYCFCYLSEEDFISFKQNYFQIYNFENQRTSVKIVQKILCDNIIKINKLSNQDLAILCFYINCYILKIFRKKELYSDQNNSYQYFNYITLFDEINDFLEVSPNEILTMKKDISENILKFNILDNKKNYISIRTNEIKCVIDNKTRIYILSPLYKASKDKLIFSGFNNIYIFDLITLEIETFIKVGCDINKILCFNDGYFLFNYQINNFQRDSFYIKKIKINFQYNELVEEISEEITDYLGKYKMLFKIEKYINNGLITIINDSLLRIYK